MKLLITLVFTIVFQTSFSQNTKLLDVLPTVDGKVTYTDVVNVDSSSKDELYNRAKKWFIDAYKSAKNLIQLDDKENGEIIGKAFFTNTWQATFLAYQSVNVWYTITIAVKDNRFKYTMTEFICKFYVEPSKYTSGTNVEITIEDFGKNREKNRKKYFIQVDKEVQSTIAGLVKYMHSAPKNDW